jgi:hypothetical protein
MNRVAYRPIVDCDANNALPAATVFTIPSEEFRPESFFIVSGWGCVSTKRRSFPISRPLQSL